MSSHRVYFLQCDYCGIRTAAEFALATEGRRAMQESMHGWSVIDSMKDACGACTQSLND